MYETNRLFGWPRERRRLPATPPRRQRPGVQDNIAEDILREIEADWERQAFRADVRRAIQNRRVLHRLNLPYTGSMKRVRQYHPLFQLSGRRLLNRDKEPFPQEISQVGQGFSPFRRQWIKNYYDDNPAAFHRALTRPRLMQEYLKCHFRYDSAIRPMTNWLNSRTHTVISGENLTRIARQHNVGLEEVKRRNRWLQERRGTGRLKGFDFIRPGDKIVLPPRWPVPRGQREPFPRQVTGIPLGERQSWLREYYQTNPLASLQAQTELRTLTQWAHRHLGGASIRLRTGPGAFLPGRLQGSFLSHISSGPLNPIHSRPLRRAPFR